MCYHREKVAVKFGGVQFVQQLINIAGDTELGTTDQRQESAENLAQALYLKVQTDRQTKGVTLQAESNAVLLNAASRCVHKNLLFKIES